MNKLNKTLSLIITFSLLGQNALFAQLPAQFGPWQPQYLDNAAEPSAASIPSYTPYAILARMEQQPLTLEQYQQRARQDAARAPWITREGKNLLALGGTAVGLLLVQQMRHNSQINRLQAQYQSSLRGAHRNSENILRNMQEEHHSQREQWLRNAQEQRQDWREKLDAERGLWTRQEEQLREQLRQEQTARLDLEKQLKLGDKKITGLSRSVQTQRAKVEKLIAQSTEREKELLAQIDRLGAQLAQSEERLNQWLYYRAPNIETEMKVYLDLFNKNISPEKRAALRKVLENEEWLKTLPAHHQKNFLRIIDKGMQVCESSTASSSAFMKVLTREAMDAALPTYERLVFLVRKLARPGNLAAMALLVTLGLTSYDARAQKLEDRLNANFNLFLEATPEQLAEMENDENLRKVCISGAQALHELSLLSPQETAAVQDLLRENGLPAQRQALSKPTAR